MNQPTGREILPILTQLWREQEQAIRQAISLFGLQGAISVPLERWSRVLADRVQPLYEEWYSQGQVAFTTQLEHQKKHIKRGAGMLFGNHPLFPQTADMPQQAEWFDVFDPNVAKFAREWAYEFAQSTLATTKERVIDAYRQTADAIAGGLERGESLSKLTQSIGLIFNDPNRALMIANTESARSYNYGQLESAKASGEVAGKEWLASSDACELCLEQARRGPIPLDQPFVMGGGKYGRVDAPPLHPHCVLAETPIRAMSLISVLHAKYDGPIIRLYFDDGSSFGVTPNHMLLCTDGFATASSLVEGDNVIRTILSESGSFPHLNNPDDNNKPALAGEIFKTLSESCGMSSCRVPVSPEYLHGDAAFCNGDIDVVRTDGLFRNDLDTFGIQPVDHAPIILRDMIDRIGLPTSGQLATVLEALLDATDRSMGRSRELLALLRSVSRVPDELGFRHGSEFDTKLREIASYYRSRYTHRLGNVKYTFPGIITTAKLIKIERETLHDVSVYDFQTNESMYIIDNGIVSSNCFCTVIWRLSPLVGQANVERLAA